MSSFWRIVFEPTLTHFHPVPRPISKPWEYKSLATSFSWRHSLFPTHFWLPLCAHWPFPVRGRIPCLLLTHPINLSKWHSPQILVPFLDVINVIYWYFVWLIWKAVLTQHENTGSNIGLSITTTKHRGKRERWSWISSNNVLCLCWSLPGQLGKAWWCSVLYFSCFHNAVTWHLFITQSVVNHNLWLLG